MPLVLLLFISVPIAEIATFIKVGGLIGLWPTLALVFATAIAGAALLRSQGFATFQRAQHSLARGELPVEEILHGFFLVIAGVLLLTPGFLTDAAGFLLFVPAVRRALAERVRAYVAKHSEIRVEARRYHARGPVIEGEAEEVTPREPEDADGAR